MFLLLILSLIFLFLSFHHSNQIGLQKLQPLRLGQTAIIPIAQAKSTSRNKPPPQPLSALFQNVGVHIDTPTLFHSIRITHGGKIQPSIPTSQIGMDIFGSGIGNFEHSLDDHVRTRDPRREGREGEIFLRIEEVPLGVFGGEGCRGCGIRGRRNVGVGISSLSSSSCLGGGGVWISCSATDAAPSSTSSRRSIFCGVIGAGCGRGRPRNEDIIDFPWRSSDEMRYRCIIFCTSDCSRRMMGAPHHRAGESECHHGISMFSKWISRCELLL
mmetsp:Transcript_28829/g.60870  ORF Transcript_28829/g.60870 Transcript_28829/m.60870 type:complete len:271 (-) Transcript_28829:47-859(-)